MLSAFLFATVNSILYMILWRLPINLTEQKTAIKYIFAFALGIPIFGTFMFLLPWGYYEFIEQILYPNLVLVNTGPWSFYTIGLFIAAFCMFPLAIWLDAETRGNVMKQNRNFLSLVLATLVFVLLPVFFSSAFEFRITESGFQSSYLFWSTDYPLSNEQLSQIKLGSYLSKSTSKRTFTSRTLEISLIQKSGEEEVILKRDYLNPDFSKSLLPLKCKANSKNIPFEVPFVLLHFTDIQAELYKDLDKKCPN